MERKRFDIRTGCIVLGAKLEFDLARGESIFALLSKVKQRQTALYTLFKGPQTPKKPQ